jgi:hypothetical protein
MGRGGKGGFFKGEKQKEIFFFISLIIKKQ